MTVRFTIHAQAQVEYRGPLAGFDAGDVLDAVSSKERKVRKALLRGAEEVRVIVKTVTGDVRLQDGTYGVYLPDGSNGQVVLACASLDEAGNIVVKTVMLQRERQVHGKKFWDRDAYI